MLQSRSCTSGESLLRAPVDQSFVCPSATDGPTHALAIVMHESTTCTPPWQGVPELGLAGMIRVALPDQKVIPGYGFSCFPTGDVGLQVSRRGWEPRKTGCASGRSEEHTSELQSPMY